MINSTNAYVRALARLAICALVAAAMASAQTPVRVTSVHLMPLSKQASAGRPCGGVLRIPFEITFSGESSETLWWHYLGPPGLKYEGGEERTLKGNQSPGFTGETYATLTESRTVTIRVEAAMDFGGGRRGPVVVSNPETFHFDCGGGTAGGGGASGGVRIGGWSLRANGQPAQGFQYTGSCPVDLKFGWGVISSEPTAVTYSISKSAGGPPTSPQTAELPGGGRSTPLYYDWHLGANNPKFANYTGWVELNIQSPSSLAQRINFTLHCGAGF
jgi:hypothetical protein